MVRRAKGRPTAQARRLLFLPRPEILFTGPKVPWAVAARLTGRLPGMGSRTAAATRLSPVDWDMDSNQGFIPASGAWRGRDVVGRTRFKSQNPARRVFSLCDSGLSAGPRSLGGVAAVL
jgi:hypothetical protein